MVCEKCEKKLGKVITPDTWKDGARNTTESGGRKLNENKFLTSKKARFDPYSKTGFATCRICKSSVHQSGSHYCQGCAYKKGETMGTCGLTVDGFVVTLGEKLHGLGGSQRRAQQPLPVRVLAELPQDAVAVHVDWLRGSGERRMDEREREREGREVLEFLSSPAGLADYSYSYSP
ncbi:hypothetical protein INR49_005700, partial [Caranx melampygus]